MPGRFVLATTLLAISAAGATLGASAARPSAAVWLADHPRGLRGPWAVLGRLGSDPHGAGPNATVDLVVHQIRVGGEWQPIRLGVRATVYERPSSDWAAGDRFEAFLAFRVNRPAANPGVAPRDYSRAAGIDLRTGLKSFRQLRRRGRPPPWSPDRIASELRTRLRSEVERRFGDRAPVVHALLLGERGDIDPNDRALLARTGLSHLLAISGLHLGLILGFCFVGVRALGGSRPLGAGACLVALVPIVFIVVGRASVWRAALMAAIVSTMASRGRRGEPLNALAITVVLLTVDNPWAVRDLGFGLSVAATAAILLLARPLDEQQAGGPPAERRPTGKTKLGPLGWLRTLATASFAAQLGAAPILALVTYRLPLAALALNLVAVPMLAITLAACLSATVLGMLGADLLADAGAWLASGCIGVVWAVARVGDRQAAALVVSVADRAAFLAAWGAVVIGALAMRRLVDGERSSVFERAVLSGATLVAVWGLIALLGSSETAERFEVVALDVGQGDAILIEAPGDGPVLVDTGGNPWGHFDPGAAIVAPALRARGVRALDAVVLSHLHADHAGGLAGLAAEMPVAAIWTGSYPPDDARARAIRSAVPRVVALGAGHRRRTAGCIWSALHPSGPWLHPGGTPVSNDASLVLSIRCASRGLLLTGDVERAAERLWARPDLVTESHLLKVPHHGSDTSSGPELLAATDARHAVITAGWRNRFGLPDADVLRRYRSRQIAVYRTDRDGGLTIALGRRIKVRGERWNAGTGRRTTGGWLH